MSPQQDRAVGALVALAGWLLGHGETTLWGMFTLAGLVLMVRLAWLAVAAWTDLRLKRNAGDAAGALAEWSGARGPDGRSGFYQAYMASDAWQARSQRTLLLAGYTCQRCGRARASQAHHVTYDRLGAERDEDLQALCKRCHDAAHGR
jgi:hypothetical protein